MGKFMVKIRNFDTLGLFSHISASISVKFEGTLPRARFHVYRGNVSPLQGGKPIFGLLSKNTGMAALTNRSL